LYYPADGPFLKFSIGFLKNLSPFEMIRPEEDPPLRSDDVTLSNMSMAQDYYNSSQVSIPDAVVISLSICGKI